MSRVGRRPVTIPSGVQVTLDGTHVRVKGPKGDLERDLHPDITVTIDDGTVTCTRSNDEREQRSLHGLTRALVANMVEGVSTGFSKSLELHGVGYKAEVTPDGVRLIVGFSHPVDYTSPKGITISVENPTLMKVEGINKQLVGQVAAELRHVRPPEPYKGKGIRYVGEHVRRKAGKTGAKV